MAWNAAMREEHASGYRTGLFGRRMGTGRAPVPPLSKRDRPPTTGLREALKAILCLAHGMPVRYPIAFPRFPRCKTAHCAPSILSSASGTCFVAFCADLQELARSRAIIDSQGVKTAEDPVRDAGRKITDRMRHMTADIEGISPVQNRDGAAPLIRELAERLQMQAGTWAEEAYASSKLEAWLSETGLDGLPKIVRRSAHLTGST